MFSRASYLCRLSRAIVLGTRSQLNLIQNSTTSSQFSTDRNASQNNHTQNISPHDLRQRREAELSSLISDFYGHCMEIVKRNKTIEELVCSDKYKRLECLIENYVQTFSNYHLASIIASALRMKLDPEESILKLLDRELRNRVGRLKLSQAFKLMKYYRIYATTTEQYNLIALLATRVEDCVENTYDLCDLLEIYEDLPNPKDTSTHLGHVEERMLDLLIRGKPELRHHDESDTTSTTGVSNADYDILCSILIKMGNYKRKSIPLLQTISRRLVEMGPSSRGLTRSNSLIATLNSLVLLEYHNRSLIGELTTELMESFNLNKCDVNDLDSLIKTLTELNWRHPLLMNTIYNHIYRNGHKFTTPAHCKCLYSLLHFSVRLNFKPELSLENFHELFKEKIVRDMTPRKKLNYVWTLAALQLVDADQLESVLSDDHLSTIMDQLSFKDKTRLLNLYAIALHKFRLDDSKFKLVKDLKEPLVEKGKLMSKFSDTIAGCLLANMKSPDWLVQDIQTPYGFLVDGEIHVDAKLQLINPVSPLLSEILANPKKHMPSKLDNKLTRVALIYLSHDDVVLNKLSEPVGHKLLISTILRYFGYKTVYLEEGLAKRARTSAELGEEVKKRIDQVVRSDQ